MLKPEDVNESDINKPEENDARVAETEGEDDFTWPDAGPVAPNATDSPTS